MLESEIIKLLRTLHLALHAIEESGGVKEETKLSDEVSIKKNGNKI